MLLLISTPIGNLGDISERAKQALEKSDLLLCEDTRHTGNLIHLLGLTPPRLSSFHKHNELKKEDEVIDMLRLGKQVGLVSDAGVPTISDPGAHLVDRCRKEGIPVSIIPGPCAFVLAFALSGIHADRFQFLGFLSRNNQERLQMLHDAATYPGASLFYESPERILETVSLISEINSSWQVTLVRELTKTFEEVLSMEAIKLCDVLKQKAPKGEFVVVLHPLPQKEQAFLEKDLVLLVHETRETLHCSLKEAIDLVAKDKSFPKRKLYSLCIQAKS